MTLGVERRGGYCPREVMTLLLCLLLLGACADGDPRAAEDAGLSEPTAEPIDFDETPEPRPTQRPRSSPRPGRGGGDRAERGEYSDPLLQNTYDAALQICEYDGPEKLAKEVGASAHDLDAIARAYADYVSKPGPHREASYLGCLKGLVQR